MAPSLQTCWAWRKPRARPSLLEFWALPPAKNPQVLPPMALRLPEMPW
jgi:hypothetical protein